MKIKKNPIFIILSLVLGLSVAAQAENRFDENETYREIQRLLNIDGNKKEALRLARELKKELNTSNDLYSEVTELVDYLGGGGLGNNVEATKKYVVGEKDEYYCKNVGLVYLKARHGNGDVSEVRRISSNVKMDGSYSRIKSGDWVAELDTAYREPMQSQVWMDESTKNSFRVREVRKLENRSFDRGKYRTFWSPGSLSESHHTTGDAPEPGHMFLATDYHLWGSHDLGFKIKFKVGAKDTISGRESSAGTRFVLTSDREVVEHLPTFREYGDCYKVTLKIKIKEIIGAKK